MIFIILSLLTMEIVFAQNSPQIVKAEINKDNQIYIKWEPNKETTENTRYKIEVINKHESFEYPGIFIISITNERFIRYSIFDFSSNSNCKTRHVKCRGISIQ